MKRILKSAEECVGKIVIWNFSGSEMRVLKLLADDEMSVPGRMQVRFLGTGIIGDMWFMPGEFYTETPDYVDRWKDRIE